MAPDAPDPAWRPLVAALGNPHAREVYAQIVLGHEEIGPGLGSARRRKILDTLLATGLVAEAEGRYVARGEAFAEQLAAGAAPQTAVGPGRYLDGHGRIERYPRDAREMTALLRMVAARVLEADEVIGEAELNGRLRVLTDDVALLRRHLVDREILERTRSGSQYALVAE